MPLTSACIEIWNRLDPETDNMYIKKTMNSIQKMGNGIYPAETVGAQNSEADMLWKFSASGMSKTHVEPVI